MVVDTSVLISILFDEPNSSWCAEKLRTSKTPLIMSSVNYAEVLIILKDRQPQRFEELVAALEKIDIEVIDVTKLEARVAALARFSYPLNLGDCFAYAAARNRKVPLITLDKDFKRTDILGVFPR
jgi:ribonuclease VapC